MPEKNGDRQIANLFGENIPTGKKLDTDYAALYRCFSCVKAIALTTKKSVAIPAYIGCGLAGGDWDYVLHRIIEPIFKDSEALLTIVYWDQEPKGNSLA